MASWSGIPESQLSCPVCHNIFRDPVLLPCGHSFCKNCLEVWWAEKRVQECAVCRRRSAGEPPPNLVLQHVCEAWSQQRGRRSSEALCSVHAEKLKLFCLNHQQPVCVVCRDSEKHSEHVFRPVDEAAADHRRKLEGLLRPLQEKLKLLHRQRENCELSLKHIRVQAQHAEKLIQQQFQKLHRFLQEDEEARISALREEEKQKSQMMEEKMEALSRDVAALSDTVLSMEDQLQAADVCFLQNFKSTLERVQKDESSWDEPQQASGTLLDEAKHLGNLAFNIWEKMKEVISYTPVVLDPNTAHPELALSEDLRTVQWGQRHHLPENPERIQELSSVLGSEGFSGGFHSWDVEVGDNEYWELGVLRGSAEGKQDVLSSLWRIRFYSGKYRACSPSEPDTDLQLKTFKRIRVQLNWNNWNEGTVSFSDADTFTPIHTFTHTCTDRLFPYFNSVNHLPLNVLPRNISAALETI